MNGQKLLVVKGRYSYTGPDGEQYQVIYVSDDNGYRAEGDHLPSNQLKGLKSSMKAMVPILAKRINPTLVASLTGG